MLKINFRPLFVTALSLILGIICLASFSFNNNWLGVLSLVMLILFAVICVTMFLLSFINKQIKFFNFINKFKRFLLSVIVGLIISVISFNVVLNLFNNTSVTNYNDVTVSGKISDVKNYNNYLVATLSNVSVNNKDVNGKLELGLTKSESSVTTNFVEGNNVTISTDLVKVTASYNTVYNIINNVKFSASSNIYNVTVTNGNKTFKDLVKHNVLNNLKLTLKSENAGIAYSILFGEKDNLSEDVYNAFSFGGLAHILAVSGLHIGFLVAMLVGLLSLIKCNKHLRNIIVLLVLIVYAYLTNFSPSVLRAVIMSMVLLLSKTYNKEYDALSALSLAAIIILAFSPFQIFTVGFQLSFACVFAIITLAPFITDCLLFIKCPKRLAETLAISLAINFGVFAITAHHFNTINFASVISNLIVLPLFSVCFMLLFIFGFIGALTPVFNFMLIIPNVILHFIKLFANLIAGTRVFNIKVFDVGYLIVLIILLALYLIKFLITKPKVKAVIGSVLIFIAIILTVVTNIPANFNSYNLNINYSRYGNNAVVTTAQNETILIVNNLTNINYITNLTDKSKLNSVDAVVCFDYSVKDNEVLSDVVTKLKPKFMVFEDEFKYNIKNEFKEKTNLRFYSDGFTLSDISFKYVKNDFSTIGIRVDVNNNKILFVADNIKKSDCYYFTENYNLIVSNNNNIDFKSFDVKYNEIITYRQTKVLSNFVLSDMLFFTKTI